MGGHGNSNGKCLGVWGAYCRFGHKIHAPMFSAFSCPACKVPFRQSKDEQPLLLRCGHSACAACCAVFAVPGPPRCPVCQAHDPGGVVNHALFQAGAPALASDSPRSIHMALGATDDDDHEAISAQLLPLLDTLTTAQHALAAVRDAAESGIAELCGNAPTVIGRFRHAVDVLVATIHAHRDSTIQEFTAVCANRTKVLQAQADELEVTVGQLSASVAQCRAAVSRAIPLGVHQALETARSMLVLGQRDLHLQVPAQLDILFLSEAVLAAVADMSPLRLYEVDGSKTIPTGGGLRTFKRRAPNRFSVNCRDSTGLPAVWVNAADVVLSVNSAGGAGLAGHLESAEVTEPGVIRLAYVVDDETTGEVELDVTVRGVEVAGGPWLVHSGFLARGEHVATLHIDVSAGLRGLTLTADGNWMLVSNIHTHKLLVYRTADCSWVRTFGSRGERPGQFFLPGSLCMTAMDTVLVAESGNRRIQEVTVAGVHHRFIGLGVFDDSLCGLAVHGDTIAAGQCGYTSSYRVVLFNYACGTLLRRFGMWGDDIGKVRHVSAMQFTRDGRHLVITDHPSGHATVMTVRGALVRHIGLGVLEVGMNAVALTCTGEVVVADSNNHRICVFSGDDGTLLRTWGTRGKGDGQFSDTIEVLAVCGSRLYVPDFYTARIQVFE